MGIPCGMFFFFFVPRSASSAKVNVKYQGRILKKIMVSDEFSCFTCVFLVERLFLWCQGQITSHFSKKKQPKHFSIKVTFFFKKKTQKHDLRGHLYFTNTSCFCSQRRKHHQTRQPMNMIPNKKPQSQAPRVLDQTKGKTNQGVSSLYPRCSLQEKVQWTP